MTTNPYDAPAAPQPGRPVDVRRIVLDVIEGNAEAARAYLLEPAMRHGVEVTVGVLGRAAAVLTTTGGHTREEAAALIREIAVACSHSGGPEDVQKIAAANSQLHPEQWNGMQFNGTPWTAVLAPLDDPSSEINRALAADFEPEPTTFPVPLREDTDRGRIIGTVSGWEIRDGQLLAHGVVDDPGVALLMGSGVLRPQMELAIDDFSDGPIPAGQLREVKAGRRALWPECRFVLGAKP